MTTSITDTAEGSREVLQAIVLEVLAQVLEVQAATLDPAERFSQQGLSSLLAARLVLTLSGRLGRPLAPTVVWDHPNARQLASFLAGERTADVAASRRLRPLPEDEPIAIVAVACRLPGAETPEAFWQLLAAGREAVGPVPAQRWDLQAWYDPDPLAPGRLVPRRGGFLQDPMSFDAAFFGMSPREAQQVDPQQRLVLELSWEALERAGIRPSQLAGSRTGVFMGAMWSEYGMLTPQPEHIGPHSATGRDTGVIANRVSYLLGLMGPSLTVNTACSSSLVAVHLACRSLRSGECSLALAGGVNLMLTPESTVAMTKFGGMAPDGRSKAFDARADGYVRGEGAALLLLKPLSQALADGDPVLALLRGSAVNNDGPSNGLTAPNPAAQRQVLQDALADAGLEPAEIGYVEAHGTGTLLGDPIEAGALGQVLGQGRCIAEPLKIGSAKTNIGHLEAAAGAAGLTKAVLTLQAGAIPPSLHFERPNPHIDFEHLRLQVPTTLQPWLQPPAERIAGVSSFGFGGTNAHVLVQGWDGRPWQPRSASGTPQAAVWVFDGNGGQWAGMGRELLAREPVVRAAVQRCEEALRALDPALSVTDFLLGRPLAAGVPATVADQCSLFALQVGLAALLRHHGLRPLAVIGHSLGEVAAAHASGALTLPDAARVAWHRSRLQAGAAGAGAMLQVEADVARLESMLAAHPEVVVAGQNAPRLWTLSGPREVVAQAQRALAAQGLSVHPLRVDVAYHSPSMEPLARTLAQQLHGLQARDGEVPFHSTVTGAVLPGRMLDAGYWGRNLREPVRFAPTVAGLPDAPCLELGPHPILRESLRLCLAQAGRTSPVAPLLARGLPATQGLNAAWDALAGTGAGAHTAPEAVDGPEVLVLSARSDAALRRLAHAHADALQTLSGAGLRDWCASAACGREVQPVRLALLATDREGLVAALRTHSASGSPAARVGPAGDQPVTLRLGAQAPAFSGLQAWVDTHWRAGDAAQVVLRAWQAAALPDLADLDILGRWATGVDEALRPPATVALAVLLGTVCRAAGVQIQDVTGNGAGALAAAVLRGNLGLDAALRDAVAGVLPATAPAGSAGSLSLCIGTSTEEPGVHWPAGDAAAAWAACAAGLHQAGGAIDWQRWYAGFPWRRVLLPGTPFERQRVLPPGLDPRYGLPDATPQAYVVQPVVLTGMDSESALPAPTDLVAALSAPPAASGEALDALAGEFARAADLPSANVQPGTRSARWLAALQRLAQLPPAAPVSPKLELERHAELALVRAVGGRLSDLLHGLADPVELLFPGGSTGLLEPLYYDAAFARGLAQHLHAAVRALPPGARLRVLEIGAGTGGSTAHLLEALPAGTEYLYTDVSPAFLAHGLRRFGHHAGLRTALLDIEDPAAVDTQAGAWDLVVAVNVLHATRRIDHTLRQVRRLLRPGGQAWIGEITGSPGWLDLVFGSLEGWWRYEDGHARQHGPLLCTEGWRQALAAAGFDAVATASDGDRQSLLVAQADRQPGATPATATFAAADTDPLALFEFFDAQFDAAGAPGARPLRVLLHPPTDADHPAAACAQAALAAYALSRGQQHPQRWAGVLHCEASGALPALAPALNAEDRLHMGPHGLAADRLVPLGAPTTATLPLATDGCWLVTGGTGSLGLRLAGWLADAGVRELVLLGRRPPVAGAALACERLRARGVRLRVLQADVADRAALTQVLADCVAGGPPVVGLVHAAGVMAAPASQVLATKLGGALALHELTRDWPLRHFILFSSAAGSWGAARYPAYAAANAGLDALARWRRTAGLPAQSVGWGRFDVPGLLDADEDWRLAELGLQPMQPEAAFDLALRWPTGAPPAFVVASVDWAKFAGQARARRPRPFFDLVAPAAPVAVPPPAAAAQEAPGTASTGSTASGPALPWLREALAEVLGHADAADLPEDLGLFDLGLDSLLAVQLRRLLQARSGIEVPAAVLFSHPTLALLAAWFDGHTTPAAIPAPALYAGQAPIAVIGIACRLPGGVNDLDSYARLLFDGSDAVSIVPAERWDWRDWDQPGGPRIASPHGGFLEGIDRFDASFFGITPKTAALMDPQQRLLLETAWHAVEDAGLDPRSLAGSRTAVYVGLTGNDYATLARRSSPDGLDAQAIVGQPANTAAGRIAFSLGLTGPAMAIDTACSSSLVAVHQAVRTLRAGEATMALAGGVNLVLDPHTSVILSRAGMLSPRGRCSAFDADADGFVRAEGCGMVLLKPLAQAQADGDPVHAVILGSAINHDGRASGFTVPNGSAQAAVIAAALADAQVAPHQVGYVEAHGTGTALGDPIEAQALAQALGTGRDQPLVVGAVKSAIGHCESASGVAGLTKAVIALREGQVPPTVHWRRLNPQVPASLPLRIAAQALPLPAIEGRRVAGVSAFGASGTNAHVLLTTAPPPQTGVPVRPRRALTTFRRERHWLERLAPVRGQTSGAATSAAPVYTVAWEPVPLPSEQDGCAGVLCGPDAAVVLAVGQAFAAADLPFTICPNDAPLPAGACALWLAPPLAGDGASAAAACADLDRRLRERPASLLVVTFAALAVTAADRPEPGAAALWGLARAVMQDPQAPPLRCIDLPAGAVRDAALARIINGLTVGSGDEDQWAWRAAGGQAIKGSLYVPRLTLMDLPAQAPALALRADRSYLVTGGGGALARALVAELVRRGARQLVLVGRSPIAPDPQLVALADGQPLQLRTLQADVADLAGPAAAALWQALEGMAPVAGIFHAAGVAAQAFEPALRPKLDGALALATVARDARWPLEVLALFGSAAGLWGDDRLPAYAAANAALSALAARMRAEGLPALAVDLARIDISGGMLDAQGAARFDRLGLLPMSPAHAWERLLQLAAAGVRHALVAQVDWARFAALQGARRPRPLLARLQLATGAAVPARPSAPPVETLPRLQSMVAQLLGTPDLPAPDQGLFSIGLDSFGVVDLRERIEAEFGQALTTADLFSAATLQDIARRMSGTTAAPQLVTAPMPDSVPVAIIGVGLRLPGGVHDLGSLARLLRDEVDAICPPPPGRADDLAPFGDGLLPAGYIDPIDQFDAERFGISPREAARIDPQHRLLLEAAWTAIASSGRTPGELADSRTGVYVGLTSTEYAALAQARGVADAHSVGGQFLNAAAGRLSHSLKLRGPSLVVDTACSSSAMALHLACRALRAGECELALAGGVNLILSGRTNALLQQAHMLSPRNRCSTFDAQADGYVRAEACVVVLLKPLPRAEADGDPVLAVLRGSAANHDGASAGFTVPSGTAQEAVIRAALADAGLHPHEVQLVEAHGTGTALGDPIELQALDAVYGDGRPAPLLVGSIKTNIGHAEAAAGMAGLVKLLVALRDGWVPRHLHYTAPNPKARMVPERLAVAAQAGAWPACAGPRRAGLSSFGASGTNVHLVLEAAPAVPLPLARADTDRLHARLQAGSRRQAGTPRVAFIFTGQGAQATGMGRLLDATQPVFRAALDACAQAMQGRLDQPLRRILFEPGPWLASTGYAQPALFAMGYALARLWQHLGVQPVAVLGHSVGEVTAACVAGALTLQDAAALIVERGRLMAQLPPGGAMLAVAAPPQAMGELLQAHAGKLALAVHNGPQACVLSGDAQAIEEAAQAFAARGIATQPLAVSHAFHSHLLEPMLDALEAVAHLHGVGNTQLPLAANVDGQLRHALDAAYWRRQAREPVQFDAGVRALLAYGCDTFIEIGPHAVLTALGRSIAPHATWIASLHRGVADPLALAEAAAAAWTAGLPVAHESLLDGSRATAVPVVWRHQRYWLPKAVSTAAQVAAERLSSWFQQRLDSPALDALVAAGRVEPDAVPQLQASGGLAHVGLLLAAASDAMRRLGQPVPVQWGPSEFLRPLHVSAPLMLQAVLRDGRLDLHSRADEATGSPWQTHAQLALVTSAGLASTADTCAYVPALRLTAGPAQSGEAFYAALESSGFRLGPSLRLLRRLHVSKDEVLAALEPADTYGTRVLGLAAEWLEVCAQLPAALRPAEGPWMLAAWQCLERSRVDASPAWVHARRMPGPGLQASITLLTADGRWLLHIDGARYARLDEATAQTLTSASPTKAPLWQGCWQWEPAPVPTAVPAARAWQLLASFEASNVDGDALAGLWGPPGCNEAGRTVLVAPVPETEDGAASWPVVQRLRDALAGATPGTLVLLVTRGATPSLRGRVSQGTGGSEAAGLQQTIEAEYRALRCRWVDLADGQPLAPALAAEAAAHDAGDYETRVRWQDGQRWAARLDCWQPVQPVGDRRLTLQPGGSAQGLQWQPDAPGAPGPGEVLIETVAAAPNFRDALVVFERLEATAGLGADLAGRVLAVGLDVQGFEPGDAVIAYVPGGAGSLSGRVRLPAAAVRPKPHWLSHAAAAALPVALLTAWQAVVEMGQLRAGQRVLLHGASSAVALAAARIASSRGARVLATTDRAKQTALGLLGLEVVADSRAPQLREALQARGAADLDLVIGAFGDTGSSALKPLLAPNGRCIDLQHGAGIDLDRLYREAPQRFGALFDQALAWAEKVLLRLPYQVLDWTRTSEVFLRLGVGQELGRLVVQLAPEPAQLPAGSWLVSGAGGAVGTALVRQLMQQGVRDFVLIDPNGLPDALQQTLQAAGARVTPLAIDVADVGALQTALTALPADQPSVTAVVHAAAVAADASLAELDAAGWQQVWRAKVEGAHALDRATRNLPVRLFLLCSSMVTVLPSARQGAYAAANAALEGLARARRARGLPAATIAWGPWAMGMGATGRSRHQRAWAGWGVQPLTPTQALHELLAHACADRDMVLACMDWSTYLGQLEQVPPALQRLASVVPAKPGTIVADATNWAGLPPLQRAQALLALVQDSAASVLGMDSAEDIRPDLTFQEQGMDSLMAIELAQAISQRLSMRLPATSAYDHPTPRKLADRLAQLLVGTAPHAPDNILPQAPAPEGSVQERLAARLTRLEALLGTGRREEAR